MILGNSSPSKLGEGDHCGAMVEGKGGRGANHPLLASLGPFTTGCAGGPLSKLGEE